jgi:hypothetical protein
MLAGASVALESFAGLFVIGRYTQQSPIKLKPGQKVHQPLAWSYQIEASLPKRSTVSATPLQGLRLLRQEGYKGLFV